MCICLRKKLTSLPMFLLIWVTRFKDAGVGRGFMVSQFLSACDFDLFSYTTGHFWCYLFTMEAKSGDPTWYYILWSSCEILFTRFEKRIPVRDFFSSSFQKYQYIKIIFDFYRNLLLVPIILLWCKCRHELQGLRFVFLPITHQASLSLHMRKMKRKAINIDT